MQSLQCSPPAPAQSPVLGSHVDAFTGSSKFKIEQLTSKCLSKSVLLGTVIYACNHTIQEAEAGESVNLKPDCV